MKKYYSEITVVTDARFVELLGDFIVSLTDEAVEIGEDRIIIRTEKETDELIGKIEDMAEIPGNSIPLKIESKLKENIDWIQSYKDSVQPIEAGRFYIRPEWHPPAANRIDIVINPALAFGSGHHATTYSCLEAIGSYVKDGDRVLDVGCGSGILALSARKIGADVDMCDTDPLALRSARENFRLNNESFSEIWEGSAERSNRRYDLVVANIIADVLRAIASQLKEKVAPNGILILSGILDRKESMVADAFSEFALLERKQRDEWITLILSKSHQGDISAAETDSASV